MMIRIVFLCVILVACNQFKNESAVPQATIDTLIRHMNREVRGLWAMQLWDSAKNYLNHLKDTVDEFKNDRLTLRWSLQKVQMFTMEDQFDSASAFMNKAVTLLGADNINYKDSFSTYLVHQNLFKERKLLDSALRVGNELYHLTLRNDSFQISTVSLELAEMYAMLDDMANMRKYMLEAWKYKDKEPENINSIAKLIMYYYDRVDKVDSAIYYLKIIERTPGPYSNQPPAQASLYENTGLLLVKKKKPKEGLQNQLKAKRILDSIGIKDSKFYNNLADTYGILGQFGKAFMYIDSAIVLAAENKDYNLLKLAWETKSELHFKKSQYRKGYAALDSAYNYSAIEMDSSLRHHARELEAKYAGRAKDNAIKSLISSNQASIKIRYQQRVIIITLIIATTLAAIIVLLLWRRKQTQIKLRETEFQQQLLRNQIEPHFIANALSTSQGFIRSNNLDKALRYNLQLAKLLRLSFSNTGKTFVPLKDDVTFIDNYLSLQTMQSNDAFDYEIDVYSGYEKDDVMIPPMLLQPFIENSILHGFTNLDHKGRILIKIIRERNYLHCVVEDNGIGLQQPAPSLINKTQSTTITKQRLILLSKKTGRRASIDIADKAKTGKGSGVRVTLEIPFLQSLDTLESDEFQKSPSVKRMVTS